jgi:hypothetical protein
MLNTFLSFFMGCTHSRTTFPITPLRANFSPVSGQRHGTYVVCLDCGKEFAYDWAEMRIGDPVPARMANREAALSTAQR